MGWPAGIDSDITFVEHAYRLLLLLLLVSSTHTCTYVTILAYTCSTSSYNPAPTTIVNPSGDHYCLGSAPYRDAH